MKCFWGPVSAPCAQDDKFSPCMNCPNPRSECPVPQNAQLSLLPEAAGRPLAAPPLASALAGSAFSCPHPGSSHAGHGQGDSETHSQLLPRPQDRPGPIPVADLGGLNSLAPTPPGNVHSWKILTHETETCLPGFLAAAPGSHSTGHFLCPLASQRWAGWDHSPWQHDCFKRPRT